MFLKGFKEKSNKKYLNKLLNERQVQVTHSKVESLGIIFNIDTIDDFELFRKLADVIGAKPNKLKVIAFSAQKDGYVNAWDECFYLKDFGWKGAIKNPDLKSFLDIDFDVLVSYYQEDILELKLMTALSKAKLKIGILQTDERLNDLIIKTNINEFEVFESEVFKYLTILNKI